MGLIASHQVKSRTACNVVNFANRPNIRSVNDATMLIMSIRRGLQTVH